MKAVLYSVLGSHAFPFDVLAREVIQVDEPDELKEKDSAVVFWGGADISPVLYGHQKSKLTWTGSWRDEIEWEIMQKAITDGIPIIGVCRGAQMLCAAAGGYLIQDVKNHGGYHRVHAYDGNEFNTNSIHHQMMVPDNSKHEVLAWTPNRSPTYIFQNDLQHPKPQVDLECVNFPDIKGLAVQWHPEAMDEHSGATQFVLNEFNKRYVTTSTT